MKRNLRLIGSCDASTGSIDRRYGPIRPARIVLALVLTVGLLLTTPRETVAQNEPERAEMADESQRGDTETWLNLRPYVLDLWGPRAGIGAGLGLVVNEAFAESDEFLLTVAPALHERVYTLSYASGGTPPHGEQDHRVLLVSARHAYTTRDWFYGFGPASAPTARTAFTLRTFQGSARLGQHVLGDRLFLQAHGRVEHYRLTDANLPNPGDATAEDQPAVTAAAAYGATAVPLRTTGAVLGLDAQYDRRDRAYQTLRGVLLQGTAERWIPVGGTTFSFFRTDLGIHAWIPITGSHRIALHGRIARLIDINGVDDLSGRLPHIVTPVVDGRQVPGFLRDRYTGNDAVVLGAAYEFPITNILAFNVEGYAGVQAASVYDDVTTQFELAFDSSTRISPDRDTYPLRPAASIGLRVGPQFRDQSYVDVAVGVGPDGLSAARISFVQRLNRARPPHHASNRWRR
ncbi:BamA/TamA family outer membrane protein [Longibacter sp.]|uniref:BamA/TamA family outer membrane protein n=1 Tax=Longibacter sp. TaxID=2045415 RepID=UPI003EBA3933